MTNVITLMKKVRGKTTPKVPYTGRIEKRGDKYVFVPTISLLEKLKFTPWYSQV